MAVAIVLLSACGENRRELFNQGMKVEGDAERGVCKLVYDGEAQAHVLDGDQVQSCLQQTEEAIALYERAAALGLKEADFVRTHEKALDRKKDLEMMLRAVREMERPEYKPPALPKD
ncbi:MAG: hypothetical protein ACPG77_11650 [Nannocystaceae bacterium]